MDRILRGVLRFSAAGFTYLPMASRLCARAARETSAQTGRRASLWASLRGLFCLLGMCLPKMSVYDNHGARTDGHIGWRVKETTPGESARKGPKVQEAGTPVRNPRSTRN